MLVESFSCHVGREAEIYVALDHARTQAHRLGFDPIDITRIEITVLELARNLIVHAGQGTIIVSRIEEDERCGLMIESYDTGPGIPDITLAMRDGYSTARTLGSGLPGVQRLMDEFGIDSTVGVGTHVRATKWVR